jgi:hypothetical protein
LKASSRRAGSFTARSRNSIASATVTIWMRGT